MSKDQILCDEAFKKLNRNMMLSEVFKLAREVEAKWSEEPSRKELLCLFKKRLNALLNHRDHTLKQVGALKHKLFDDMSLKHFLGLIVPIERLHVRSIRDDEYLIDSKDKTSSSTQESSPLYLIAENIRSSFNTGSLYRTAECLGVKKIFLCGYTATPDHGKTKQTAMGTESYIDWQWHQSAIELIDDLKKQGIFIVALETAMNAKSIYDFEFPKPCALVVGNERHGLETSLLDHCDLTAKIPVYGRKNSLNVGAAFAIAGYEIKRQWSLQ